MDGELLALRTRIKHRISISTRDLDWLMRQLDSLWTCFHCGETFTTRGAAGVHFGATQLDEPGCLIARVPLETGGTPEVGRGLLMELRKVQTQNASLRAENEHLDHEAGLAHQMVRELERYFGEGVRTPYQAWLKLEAMESRAMAAEDRASRSEMRWTR